MTVKRYHAEIGTALVTGGLGVAAILGAAQLGVGWSDHGPQAGYFPFWVAIVLIAGSLWNLARAVLAHRQAARTPADPLDDPEDPFLPAANLRRIAVFFGAMTAFVLGTLVMGIYVAATAYIGWSAWKQGGFRLWVGLGLGAAFAVTLYAIFEMIFQIPLLKGPIEPLLGIY
ncbi:tripartite tricarboxylate transporter TctB family protein (plasmid) [Paracoccus liaowanqingii]|uniref:Tripartite tricarboxylate transporter TctB family protein n=1 Tax=Paracoccus liaowanqingii TaxID=2560053 RepID=A0A4Y5SUG7_9RHOB|nr:tripartite tricarboxylate transporter TctB family protein [Paracoccus liaowanqingii]QDA36989.1 tripartite tricarboxylate transporter TctB family protein [Paracoccus liaowanqingii]